MEGKITKKGGLKNKLLTMSREREDTHLKEPLMYLSWLPTWAPLDGNLVRERCNHIPLTERWELYHTNKNDSLLGSVLTQFISRKKRQRIRKTIIIEIFIKRRNLKPNFFQSFQLWSWSFIHKDHSTQREELFN